MDFRDIASDTADEVQKAIDRVLASKVAPAEKMRLIAKIFRSVGIHFHGHLYNAVGQVFDSSAMRSVGLGNSDDQEQRLANKLVRNYALGRPTEALTLEYFDAQLGKAQYEAFQNARSMQKHPVMTREIVSETCKWCRDKAAASPYTNPRGEDFGRHDKCDCLIMVSGYNSRNGVVENFKKKG